MTIIVVLSEDAARAQHAAQTPAEGIAAAVSALGYQIRPLHPGSNDPVLRTHFFAEVPDQQAAEQVLTALRGLPGVEGAYTKPADEPAVETPNRNM